MCIRDSPVLCQRCANHAKPMAIKPAPRTQPRARLGVGSMWSSSLHLGVSIDAVRRGKLCQPLARETIPVDRNCPAGGKGRCRRNRRVEEKTMLKNTSSEPTVRSPATRRRQTQEMASRTRRHKINRREQGEEMKLSLIHI